MRATAPSALMIAGYAAGAVPVVSGGYRPEFRASTARKTAVFGADVRYAIANRLPEPG